VTVPYAVSLDNFGGPLDFLLYLIRKNEVEIYDIPIAKITFQYLEYLDQFNQLPLEEASEFMALAATLLAIKAKALVPHLETEDGEEEWIEDPRQSLVQQLLEYRKCKESSLKLLEYQKLNFARLTRPSGLLEEYLDDEWRKKRHYVTTPEELYRTYLQLAPRIEYLEKRRRYQHQIQEEIPLEKYKKWILDLHPHELDFVTLFEKIHQKTAKQYDLRKSILGLFLALLELAKQHKVFLKQEDEDSIQHLYISVPPSETGTSGLPSSARLEPPS
jgi:segregation and condensation protein A